MKKKVLIPLFLSILLLFGCDYPDIPSDSFSEEEISESQTTESESSESESEEVPPSEDNRAFPSVSIFVNGEKYDHEENIGSFSLNEMPFFSYRVDSNVKASSYYVKDNKNIGDKTPIEVGEYKYVVSTLENDLYKSTTQYISFSLYDDSFYINFVTDKTIADIKLENNKVLYEIKCEFLGEYFETEVHLFDEDVFVPLYSKEVDLNNKKITYRFDITSFNANSYLFYPHLYLDRLPYDGHLGDIRNDNLSTNFLITDKSVSFNNKVYTIIEQFNMPNIRVSNAPLDETNSIVLGTNKIVSLETRNNKPYFVVEGVYTGTLNKSDIKIDIENYVSKKEFDIFEAGNHIWKGYIDLTNAPLDKLMYPHIYYKNQTITNKEGDILDLGLSAGETIIYGEDRFTIYEEGYGECAPIYGCATIFRTNIHNKSITFRYDAYTLEVKNDKPYFTIEGMYFGEAPLRINYILYDRDIRAVCDEVIIDTSKRSFKAYFNLTTITSNFYPHLRYFNEPWGAIIGYNKIDLFVLNSHIIDMKPISVNGVTYSVFSHFGMPVISIG